MEFPKDILIVDFEGLQEPLQIGAVLLDNKTLEEKDSFSSYVYADLVGDMGKFSGITQDMLKDAPSQADVGNLFYEKFGTGALLAGWVVDGDRVNFKKLIAAAGKDIEDYDYHVFDIWPAAYVHLLKRGYSGSMRSEEMFQTFGAKPRGTHDALEDCRIVADVLRKISFDEPHN